MTLTKSNVSIGLVVAIMITVVMPINLHLGFFPYFDKVAHFIACGVMVIALAQNLSIRKAVLITFLLFTGAELLQNYLPNRGASIGDFLANTTGILSTWFIYRILQLTKRIN